MGRDGAARDGARCPVRRGETRFRWKSWVFLADVLLAVVLLVLQLIAMFQGHGHEHTLDWRVFAEVIASGSLLLRRRFPVAVFLVVVVALVSRIAAGHLTDSNLITVLIALYTLSACVRTRVAIGAVLLVIGVSCVPGNEPNDWTVTVLFATMAAVTATLGQVQRRSVDRALRLEQSLVLLDDAHRRLEGEAVTRERTRIARELHDIVAHGLSVIAVHAGVARLAQQSDPDETAEAIRVIENASRDSLAEMRHLLGVLRSPDEDVGQGSHPPPDLRRLPDLFEQARSSGLALEVVHEGEPRELPPGHELVVYRVVQEALTNVLKHAGQVRTAVALRYLGDRVVIEVFNEVSAGHVPPVGSAPGGHGLVGMRERVGMYGGTVTAKAVDGGFQVTAELPIESEVQGGVRLARQPPNSIRQCCGFGARGENCWRTTDR